MAVKLQVAEDDVGDEAVNKIPRPCPATQALDSAATSGNGSSFRLFPSPFPPRALASILPPQTPQTAMPP